MRRACLHMIPNGAKIDDATASVTLNGAVIAQYDPCPPRQSAGSPDAGYNIVAQVTATVDNPTTEVAYGTVPALPRSPVSGENMFLWQGLLFPNGDLLQPLLNYLYTNSACPGGGNCYSVNAFFFGNKSNLGYYTGGYPASPGDGLYFASYAYQPGGWYMFAYDETNGYNSYAYASEATPGGTGATMFGNALEPYNFSNCSALPADWGYDFFDVMVYTGSIWNQYNPQNLSWWASGDLWQSWMAIPDCGYGGGYAASNYNADAFITYTN